MLHALPNFCTRHGSDVDPGGSARIERGGKTVVKKNRTFVRESVPYFSVPPRWGDGKRDTLLVNFFRLEQSKFVLKDIIIAYDLINSDLIAFSSKKKKQEKESSGWGVLQSRIGGEL